MPGQCCKVIGIVIHIVTVAGLAGAAMAAPVMRDHTEALVEKKYHLRVPIVRRQRPAMAEDDRLPLAPILVVDLRAVRRGDRAHGATPFPLRCLMWAGGDPQECL